MNQSSSDKWLILGLCPEIYKMKLKHIAVPENKEMLKSTSKIPTLIEAHQRGTRAKSKGIKLSIMKQSKEIN